MPALLPTCRSDVRASEADLQVLAAVPGAVHELESMYWCELEARHRGDHWALGQAGRDGRRELWVTWRPGRRRIVAAAGCPGAVSHVQVCVLAVRHAGRHGYELASSHVARRPAPFYRTLLEAGSR